MRVYQIVGNAPGGPLWRDGKVYRNPQAAWAQATRLAAEGGHYTVMPLDVRDTPPPEGVAWQGPHLQLGTIACCIS